MPTRHPKYIFLVFSLLINLVIAGNEIWPDGFDRPLELPTISSFEVMCGKDHMEIQVRFSGPFNGIVSSKGHMSDPNCIYVRPSMGQTFYAFRVPYAKCGTKPDLNGQFYENTVVIQYDKDLVEAWDEPKKLRCEWYNEYEKTASKPPMVIADLDVIQLDFRGDNVDCWMEIQSGKGPWSQPVSGIVPIGSTLTLVVAINDYRGEFDMRVKSCVASDGTEHIINLTDEFGCVLRPKMISRFIKARAPNDKATVITYAFFHAFKFPDALSVHIKCKVEICRHGCNDHCTMAASNKRSDMIGEKMISAIATAHPEINRLDTVQAHDSHESGNEIDNVVSYEDDESEPSFYEEFAEAVGLNSKNNVKETPKTSTEKPNLRPKTQLKSELKHPLQFKPSETSKFPIRIESNEMPQETPFQQQNIPPAPVHEDSDDDFPPPQDMPMQGMLRQSFSDAKKAIAEKFPHGPRSLGVNRIGLLPPPLPQPKRSPRAPPSRPRLLSLGGKIRQPIRAARYIVVNRTRRHRRSVAGLDNQSYSADIGVVGVFDVVSEADLAFSPSDGKTQPETVLQGKIEEVIYGICMPMPVFGVLSILIGFTTMAMALITGSLLYRYQVQRATFEKREKQTADANIDPNSLASWITLRLFGVNESMHPSAAMADIGPDEPSKQ